MLLNSNPFDVFNTFFSINFSLSEFNILEYYLKDHIYLLLLVTSYKRLRSFNKKNEMNFSNSSFN